MKAGQKSKASLEKISFSTTTSGQKLPYIARKWAKASHSLISFTHITTNQEKAIKTLRGLETKPTLSGGDLDKRSM